MSQKNNIPCHRPASLLGWTTWKPRIFKQWVMISPQQKMAIIFKTPLGQPRLVVEPKAQAPTAPLSFSFLWVKSLSSYHVCQILFSLWKLIYIWQGTINITQNRYKWILNNEYECVCILIATNSCSSDSIFYDYQKGHELSALSQKISFSGALEICEEHILPGLLTLTTCCKKRNCRLPSILKIITLCT